MNSIAKLAVFASLSASLSVFATGCAGETSDSGPVQGAESAATIRGAKCTVPNDLSFTEPTKIVDADGNPLQLPQIYAIYDWKMNADGTWEADPSTKRIIQSHQSADALYSLHFYQLASELRNEDRNGGVAPQRFSFAVDTWAGVGGGVHGHKVSGVVKGEKTLDVQTASFFPGAPVRELTIQSISCVKRYDTTTQQLVDTEKFESLVLDVPLFHLEFDKDNRGVQKEESVCTAWEGQPNASRCVNTARVPVLKWVRTKVDGSTQRQARRFTETIG